MAMGIAALNPSYVLYVAISTTTLPAAELLAHRERFPAMLDGDTFSLS